MMKTRQALTLLLFSGLLFFSSCLKNDPSNHNTTLFYGHQDIPNINYYMPQALLDALSEKDSLFFGENPPGFYFDSCCYSKDTTFVLAFMDSCFGKTGMTFKKNDESSSTSKTYEILNKKWKEYCLDTNTIAPIFFDTSFNGSAALDPEVLRHAYIMGKDPYFTLYYYEVRIEQHQYQPLNAVILSGECVYTEYPIDTIQITVNDSTVVDSIVNRRIPHYLHKVQWGVETMKYFPKDNSAQVALDAALEAGTQPQPGDVIIKEFDTLYIKPYKTR